MSALKKDKADLRAKYKRNLNISLVVSLALLIAAFKFSPKIQKQEIISDPPQDTIRVEMPPTTQTSKPPLPPKPPQIIMATLDDVFEDIELDDITYEPDDPISPVPPPIETKLNDEEKIFVVVEQIPEPIGGLKSIQEKLKYTEIAKRIELQGTVYIEAVIDKNGNVAEARILKGLGGGLDESALKAVLLTKFHPGKQRGKPVNVKMVIPIKFVLR